MEPSIATHAELDFKVQARLATLFSAAAAEQDADAVRGMIRDLAALIEAVDYLKRSALAIEAPMSAGTYADSVRGFDDLAQRTRGRPKKPLPPGLSQRFHESLCAARDAMADYVRAVQLHSSKFDPMLPGTYDANNLNDLFALWATPNS